MHLQGWMLFIVCNLSLDMKNISEFTTKALRFSPQDRWVDTRQGFYFSTEESHQMR